MRPVYELLGRFIDIINASGEDSDAAQAFIAEHAGNAEFMRLAEAARALRRLFDGR